ncbi:beta galactosidase jelly roll domain-containing protein [Paenibacillus sp. MWE-103]|uniref:Beta galactosidase jelly roll domain-containing protein n=1 Tax=Paenibacillus artemisiicola TaxID=1172618 RepID=A0ABS3WI17_9BACL|nr:sugar-binding domain-containing protein [Paenibacillus artemisiicola]MBO7747962.1 beta galactosidase jelly roll domain-containing protein [Paenibacillus artemisiicola]
MTLSSYRPDYPRPQFVRKDWQNLNGTWDFRFDDGDEGEAQGWFRAFNGDRRINVPFAYETKASGIGDETAHARVWYRRTFDVPEAQRGNRILLHFQGVDYVAKVWVNGAYVGSHEGGYAAFSFDVTPHLRPDGENVLIVKAEDSESGTQPRGKQRWRGANFGCWYVQTTGIWQTVWLEYVHPSHVESVKITPDVDANAVRFDYRVKGAGGAAPLRLTTSIRMDGELIKETAQLVDRAAFSATVDLVSEKREWRVEHWRPGNPKLYEVDFELREGDRVVDRVASYFGLRKISIVNGQMLLNYDQLYQRLILDQGYWTDSHLTPPSEEAIIADIDAILAMGYNGVRKHQKIEDARFLYWCDVKGVLVWSEAPATYEFNDEAVERFTREWMEIVRQQYNHPSIVTWVPFNESWGIGNVFADKRQQQFTEAIYHLTKAFDPHRPVIVNDGWEHTVSDILTLHDYEESGDRFLARYADMQAITDNGKAFNTGRFALAQGYEYRGQPIILSEFGGIAFKDERGWGYGNQVSDEAAFLARFESITKAIKATPNICGYCYTQVTDVQQEVNGLLTEDRQPKVPLDAIKAINLT